MLIDLGQKKVRAKNSFGRKKMFGPKKGWAGKKDWAGKKKFGLKNIWADKKFRPKAFPGGGGGNNQNCFEQS